MATIDIEIPVSYLSIAYGPVPTGLLTKSDSISNIEKYGCAKVLVKSVCGLLVLIVTVLDSSSAFIESYFIYTEGAELPFPLFSCLYIYSIDSTTAEAVSSLPFENLTPSRIWNVHSVLSSFTE